MFVFRGRQGDLIKVIWWDGPGSCLLSKRPEKRQFVWPARAAMALRKPHCQAALSKAADPGPGLLAHVLVNK